MRLRLVAAFSLLAAAALAGCESLPPEEAPEGTVPAPYYGTPPPPVYYGPPPVVFYEYYYDPFWYPHRFIPGPVIVVPDQPSAPPRVRPRPGGGGVLGGAGGASPPPTPSGPPPPRVRPRP